MHQILRYRCVYFFVNLNLGIVFISVLDTLNFRMEHITDQTTIADLSKIHVPKCYEKCVYKAIGSSTKLMTIKEFIDTTEFNINPETFDILFMNINDEDIPIYIDDAMLDWMGYSRNDSLIKHINRNFEEGIEYKNLKNNKYKEFLDEETKKIKDTYISIFKSNFPEPATGSSARSIKHLIVMPDAFRSLCMMINTEKGKQIRKYYITLEKLIKSYNLYQTIYRSHEAEKAMTCKDTKLDDIKTILLESKAEAEKHRIEAKADYEKKQAESEKIHEERFNKLYGKAEETQQVIQSILPERVRISKVPTIKNHVFVILKDTDDNEGFPYYALRRQNNSINSAIQSIKKKYPSVVVYFQLNHAGSIHFWNEVKFSHLHENIIHTEGTSNWFKITGLTESEFKRSLKKLDLEKMKL